MAVKYFNIKLFILNESIYAYLEGECLLNTDYKIYDNNQRIIIKNIKEKFNNIKNCGANPINKIVYEIFKKISTVKMLGCFRKRWTEQKKVKTMKEKLRTTAGRPAYNNQG